jgi:hypothetical protein
MAEVHNKMNDAWLRQQGDKTVSRIDDNRLPGLRSDRDYMDVQRLSQVKT